ncbi:MAG: M15 family metallopeptidase [Eubacteriales bacterium]|nr:M15 family metallopeptidase [Eubacteriales bacterium]
MHKKNTTSAGKYLLAVLLILCIGEGVLGYAVFSENRNVNRQLEAVTEKNDALKKENSGIKEENRALKEELETFRSAAKETDSSRSADEENTRIETNGEVQQIKEEERSDALKDGGGTETEGDENFPETTGTEASAVTAGEKVMSLDPGTIMSEEEVSGNVEAYFGSQTIEVGDTIYNRINGQSYRENENIQLSQLRYLKMVHWNFAHQVQVGEMIVNEAISEDVINVFKELFQAGYEVQSMYLIDNFWTGDGDSSDTASINSNNTSAFCYRLITGGSGLSNHAYGCAIDINPQQNPYVWHTAEGLQWTHENASPYVDRTSGDPHVIVEGDTCWSIFSKYGFSWGGSWADPTDYQHFEKPVQ